jgi:hypothetical protein
MVPVPCILSVSLSDVGANDHDGDGRYSGDKALVAEFDGIYEDVRNEVGGD